MVSVVGKSAPAASAWDIELVALYGSHRTRMVRLAFLLIDDLSAAEDLVQDAFVALHRRWGSVDPAAAAGYLRITVINAARSWHRRRFVVRRHQRRSEPDSAAPSDFAVLLAEEHQQVVGALRRLPRRQREVLVLRYWSGLTEAEIAAALGVSRGTVKSSASRALQAIKLQLGDDHDH